MVREGYGGQIEDYGIHRYGDTIFESLLNPGFQDTKGFRECGSGQFFRWFHGEWG